MHDLGKSYHGIGILVNSTCYNMLGSVSDEHRFEDRRVPIGFQSTNRRKPLACLDGAGGGPEAVEQTFR
jgi:hypothetical protein